MPVNVRLEDAGFAEVSRILKRAGEGELRKQMYAEARAVAKPILTAMREDVMALDSSAKRIGSAQAARGIAATKRKKGESSEDYAGRVAKNLGKGKGSLRAAVARSLRIAARDSGYKVGVRIKTEGTRMPEGQKYLPRGLDSAKGWRHPIFGTDTWVTQYGNPPGWFMSNAKAQRPLAERRMKAVVDKFVRELASRLDRAA